MWSPGRAEALLRQRERAASRAARTSSARTSRLDLAEPAIRSGSRRTRTTPSAGRASAATASGSSTSAAPTCGSSARRRRAAAEARHRGQRRRQVEHRADASRSPGTRPSSPSRRTRTPRSSSCTANCSWSKLPGRRQGHAADRLARVRPRRQLRPDGKSILFLSDRTGHEDLYLLEPDDPEHPELTKAHKFKVKRLTSTPEAETGATLQPRRATASRSSAAASSGR